MAGEASVCPIQVTLAWQHSGIVITGKIRSKYWWILLKAGHSNIDLRFPFYSSYFTAFPWHLKFFRSNNFLVNLSSIDMRDQRFPLSHWIQTSVLCRISSSWKSQNFSKEYLSVQIMLLFCCSYNVWMSLWLCVCYFWEDMTQTNVVWDSGHFFLATGQRILYNVLRQYDWQFCWPQSLLSMSSTFQDLTLELQRRIPSQPPKYLNYGVLDLYTVQWMGLFRCPAITCCFVSVSLNFFQMNAEVFGISFYVVDKVPSFKDFNIHLSQI